LCGAYSFVVARRFFVIAAVIAQGGGAEEGIVFVWPAEATE